MLSATWAARVAGVDCPMRPYLGSDPVGFVVSLNLRRRHLSESQRAMVAAKLANLSDGQRADRRSANLPTLLEPVRPAPVRQDEAARLLNVSDRTLRTARTVQERGAPELVSAVERGSVSVSAAADVATRPAPEQRAIVARGEREILEAAKAIRAERADRKREARTALLTELSNRNAPLPQRRYPIVYADPPWQYDFSPSNAENPH